MSTEAVQSLAAMIKNINETAQDLTSDQSPSLRLEGEIGPLAGTLDLDADGFRVQVTVMPDDNDRLGPVRQVAREYEHAKASQQYEKLIVGYGQPARSKAKTQRRGRGRLR